MAGIKPTRPLIGRLRRAPQNGRTAPAVQKNGNSRHVSPICTSLVQKCGSENLENIHTFLKLVWRLIFTSEVIQMWLDDFFLIICMRDSPSEDILTIWTYSVQKCCLENLQNIHFFLKLVWRLILTSEVIKMRSEDFFFKICLRGIPTEDILSICTTLDQK